MPAQRAHPVLRILEDRHVARIKVESDMAAADFVQEVAHFQRTEQKSAPHEFDSQRNIQLFANRRQCLQIRDSVFVSVFIVQFRRETAQRVQRRRRAKLRRAFQRPRRLLDAFFRIGGSQHEIAF